MFICDWCGDNFIQSSHLNRHISSLHKREVKLKCYQCDFVTNRKDSLTRHKKSSHSPKHSTSTIEINSEVKCPHCSSAHSTRGNLYKHIKLKHSHEVRYICDRCGKGFHRKDYFLNHIKSHDKIITKKPPIKIRSRINIEEDPRVENIESTSSKSAFKGMIKTKTWRIRGSSDPLSLMNKYHNAMKRALLDLLIKNALKFYISMIITMVRKDKDGVKERTTAFFQGSTRILLRASQIPEMLQSSTDKIMESFDIFLKNGSGWILETIDYLHLFTAEYTPIHGNSYIPTPQAIVDKKAIINPENQNENCIKYCIAASQHHHQMDKKHLDRPSQYEQYFKNFNFEGCSIPMEIDDFTKFEKNNNMAINVYHIKHDGKLISPLRITQRDVRPEEYVNLLLIEGEEHCHYTWIKNFDRLLSYGDHHTRQFCPFCCHGFDVRYNKSLEEHLPLCRTKGGQKTIIPPKGKNIVEFKDQHKCLKHPVVIYADFEAINKKIINHEVDQENSKTINKTEHICSGYSYTVVSPFFENRVKTYRGEDAGKHFIETVLKEEIIISKWLKEIEKKEHNLTADEEKQWQAETKCHICSDKFLKGCLPHSAKEEHLKHIEHYLLTNKLDITKIPSLKLVKKQKRIISLQLHPDKQGDVSEREKLLKQEELKKFNVENENLQNYLIDNELIEETEQDEEFELEDELSKEDIERIMKKGWKVRDHDNWTGQYRGAAHSGCNLALRKTKKIPIIFHNLSGKVSFILININSFFLSSGYDGHIIMQSIPKVKKCKDPLVIAKSMEKFIGFTIGRLKFMDSLQHLTSSLDKLVNNLAAKAEIIGCKYCPQRGPPKAISRHEKTRHTSDYQSEYTHTDKSSTLPELFPNLHAYFMKKWKNISNQDEAFSMLTRKLSYPYCYMDSFDKFKETQLPTQKAFFSDLTKKDISDADYKFAKEIWKTFKLKNLGELQDLYVEVDTLLLADVFESYRKVIHNKYGLEPVHFYTAPSLSWSAGLKLTKAKLEIPLDVNMHLFIDSGLRGGISMVCDAFARANNKYLKEYYDPSSLQSFLMFVDANNLYGWAMSQMLPTGGFKWISLSKGLKRPEVSESIGGYRTMSEWTDDILRLDEEDSIGYIFQVDLEYPDNLRSDETHDNFPLAPESLKIEKDMLSTYQQNLGDQLGVKYGGEKLCLTLNDKTQYICHARNLKFYLKHGLKFKKIHKILKFEQSQWLKPYIDLNTKLRQEADNKFEEGFAKLMNNSFFGEYTYFIM